MTDNDIFDQLSAGVSFSSDMTIKLVRHCAADDYVVQAAQVSAKGENKPGTEVPRLINVLMRDRHGSPFEHATFTFFVEVPLFVVREWQRHRISSFNEMSGRYTVLPGKFYIPDMDRVVVNSGTKMRPEYVNDSPEQKAAVRSVLMKNSMDAWKRYNELLDDDIANEVSRLALPLNIYTQMYWTVNARSLMNFLSLRSSQEGAAVVSRPQREIQMGAEKIESHFAHLMPFTYAAFLANGRVAP